MFITIEGIEGSGKSTIVQMLDQFLTSLNVGHIITKEPGAIGNQIKNLINENKGQFTPMTEALLYAADRRLNFEKVIFPSLDVGNVVISERSIDTSIVYQGVGGKIPFSQIVLLQKIVTNHLRPDLTFIIDLPSNLAYQRINNIWNYSSEFANNISPTIEEMQKREEIRQGFLRVKSDFGERDIVVVDGSKTIELVFQEIRDHIISHRKFPHSRATYS